MIRMVIQSLIQELIASPKAKELVRVETRRTVRRVNRTYCTCPHCDGTGYVLRK